MIFITGGKAQGKRKFAQERAGSPCRWIDGETADWEEFMGGRYCYNFHLFIRRVLKGQIPLPKGEGYTEARLPERACIGGPSEELACIEESIIGRLFLENPERILLTDDIGGGIVPVDPFERLYREETGRICCRVAAEAKEVWRVCCGLGQRIK